MKGAIETQPGAESGGGRTSVLGPALLLTSGRMLAFGAAFFIPVVLARVFTPEEFGTYKQIFLLFASLYYIVQLGVATSLFYFVPRQPENAGRFVGNALAVLAVAGVACAAAMVIFRDVLAWLFNNPEMPRYAALLAAYVLLMLLSAPLEVAMIARNRHRAATWSYALSDVLRAGLFILPAALTADLTWLMAGAVGFALARAVAMALWFRRGVEGGVKPDRGLLREQLAYSLPFGLAVMVATLQTHYHQYAVSHEFDAATFAIYAVGCLQIPLVDFVATPTGDVMMVRMTEELRDGDEAGARATWHDAVGSLALLLFPLVGVLLLVASDLIVLLFTETYAASIPIFMLWTLGVLLSPIQTDGVLRVHARTRLLLMISLIQLALIAALIGPFLEWFGLSGAVLITLVALAAAKGIGLGAVHRLLELGVRDLLPWRSLALVTVAAAIAYGAGWAARSPFDLPALPAIALAGTVYAAVYAALVRWWGLAPDPRPWLRSRWRRLTSREERRSRRAARDESRRTAASPAPAGTEAETG